MIIFKKAEWLIRHLQDEDQQTLVKWLSDSLVLEFYEGRDNPFDLQLVKEKFYQTDDATERCIIEFDGEKIGYIQFYKLDEETKNQYGISGDNLFGMDQFIGNPAYWNQGLGTRLVSIMVNVLIKEKHAKQIVMDPQVRNKRALRCYEKAGFKKVKLLSRHELHEGKYEDCWLIKYSS